MMRAISGGTYVLAPRVVGNFRDASLCFIRWLMLPALLSTSGLRLLCSPAAWLPTTPQPQVIFLPARFPLLSVNNRGCLF